MAQRTARTQLDARLERLLDQAFAGRHVHSAVMAVAAGDGTLLWEGARGEVSPGGPPMSPETPWFTASITKLYIAAVILRLVEEGRLALEDRLVDRLPDRITAGLHRQGGEDHTGRITVEHLLAHASGLPDFIEDYPPRELAPEGDRRSLVDLLVREGDRDWTLEDTAERVRTRLRPHFPPQPLGEPGIRVRYSDTNFQLLIGIAEEAEGRPFHEILSALVLAPLGLNRTWLPGLPGSPVPEPDVATLYAGEHPVRWPRFLASIQDLYGTTSDLLRFLLSLRSGTLFRDPGSWPRMHGRLHRFGFPTDRAALRQPSWPIAYGLGVMEFRLPRPLTPFRPVPTVLGHTGSTGTWLFHAPELDVDLVGAVSQVTAGPLPFRIVPKILRAVAEESR